MKQARHTTVSKILKGIVFLDIFPILRDPLAFETLVTHFVHHLVSHTIPKIGGKIDAIVGLDARGFLLGPIIALRLGAAFVPVRKKGKLPGKCTTADYAKEYGIVGITVSFLDKKNQTNQIPKDTFEMQADSIKPGSNVIIVDDLIATGRRTDI